MSLAHIKTTDVGICSLKEWTWNFHQKQHCLPFSRLCRTPFTNWQVWQKADRISTSEDVGLKDGQDSLLLKIQKIGVYHTTELSPESCPSELLLTPLPLGKLHCIASLTCNSFVTATIPHFLWPLLTSPYFYLLILSANQ